MAVRGIQRFFTRYPIAANGVSGGTFAIVGDVATQKGIEGCDSSKGRGLDLRRVGAMALFGLFYTGPVCHTLYSSYASVLPAALLRRRGGEALGSTLLDNFVHLPVLYVPAFYIGVGFMQGQSRAKVEGELRARYSETLLTSWGYWVPFMATNFAVVPPHLRTIVMQCGNLVWSGIISFISHRQL